MPKRLFSFIGIFLLVIVTVFSYFSYFKSAKAILVSGTEYNNLRGWAWSSNIGWISFSCHRAEAVVGGASFGSNAEVENCSSVWGAHIVQTSEAQILGYPAGTVIGRAWSDNVGWISFMRNETGDPPITGNSAFDSLFEGRNYIARFKPSTKTIIGWARVLSACKNDSSGKPDCSLGTIDSFWDGWVYFPDTSYGVRISDGSSAVCGAGYDAGDWCGYAWGGNNIGWIQFVKDTDLSSVNPSVVSGGIAGNSPPDAVMNLIPSVSLSGNSYVGVLSYDGTSSSDPDFGDYLSFLWDFGDGTTSTNPSGSHTYSYLGEYTVTLTVTDPQGASDSVSQTITFTNPGALNLCAVKCSSDADCPADSYCLFTTPGSSSGVCVLKPALSDTSSQTSLGGDLNSYICDPDPKAKGVLKECKPDTEQCSASGTYPSNGDSCSPGDIRVVPLSVSSSGFKCGVDSGVLNSPYCVGDVFEVCPSSGTCPNSGDSCTPGNFECKTSSENEVVYICSTKSNTSAGTPITSTIPPVPDIPLLPKGIQPGGEACTKPTPDAPTNCQGINGCMYYGYDNAGNPLSNIVAIANCIGDTQNNNLNIDGCFYNAGASSSSLCDASASVPSSVDSSSWDLCRVNVCENKYPLGCVFYNYSDSSNSANNFSLANCMPAKSYAGIPSSACKEIKYGGKTAIDCTADTSDSGGGCIFYDDGSIDCTSESASGKPYAGYVFTPTNVEYKGIKNVTSSIALDTYVNCVQTDRSVSTLAKQNACSSDGSCPAGEICIAGTCMNKCSTGGVCGPDGACPSGFVCNQTTNTCENPDFNPNDACSLGTACTGICPDGYFWDTSVGSCQLIEWAQYPACSNAYFKTSLSSDTKYYPSENLPTGISQAFLFIQTLTSQNCRYSTDPSADFASMTEFDLTGSTTNRTLLSGLFPLPTINNYLIRCQDTSNPSSETACKVSAKVGTECSANNPCSVGVCVNGICQIPQCSNASPSGVLPEGTQDTTISMTTNDPSLCKYSDTLFNSDGDTYDFNTMPNTMLSVGDAGLTHYDNVSGLVPGYNDYFIQCKDNSSGDLSGLCSIQFAVDDGSFGACSSDSACAPGFVCFNGKCTLSGGTCSSDSACASGFVCSEGLCKPNNSTCSSDSACAPGFVCFNGSCVSNNLTCGPNNPCAPGFVCQNGLCSSAVNNPQDNDVCPAGYVFDPITGDCVKPSVPVAVLNPQCDILGLSFKTSVVPGTGIGPTANCSIVHLIIALIYWMAWIVTVLAVIYGLRGAYTYITANGDSKRLELAKKYLIYTVVGIIVALISFAIVAIVKSAF